MWKITKVGVEFKCWSYTTLLLSALRIIFFIASTHIMTDLLKLIQFLVINYIVKKLHTEYTEHFSLWEATKWECSWLIFNSGARKISVLSFTPWPLNSRRNKPNHPLNRRVFGPQSRSARFGVENIFYPCREFNHDSSVTQPIGYLLYRLCHAGSYRINNSIYKWFVLVFLSAYSIPIIFKIRVEPTDFIVVYSISDN
jgi:hypothetical protein